MSWADKILNGGWDTLSTQEREDILRAVFNPARMDAINKQMER